MLFDFLSPPRIIFGSGCLDRLGEEAARLGKKALLITGRRSLEISGMLQNVINSLRTAEVDIVSFNEVDPDPTIEVVEVALAKARDEKVDLIIGVGGGSVLDVAKAVAGLYKEKGTVKEYFEGKKIEHDRLHWIAVPTTAGSGSEVTRNAVLTDPAAKQKKSIRCDWWIADAAVVDPVLTLSLPARLTAITGMDALTHALEGLVSRWSNPLTYLLALEAAVLICGNLYSAYTKGNNRSIREKICLGSLMAGMALNNARLGAVHALAHPLGVHYRLPHGLVCGILLPYVMEFNMNVVDARYAEVAYRLGLVSSDTHDWDAAQKLLSFIKALRTRLEIPQKLGDVGLRTEDIPVIAEAAFESGSLAANPKTVRFSDLVNILEKNL